MTRSHLCSVGFVALVWGCAGVASAQTPASSFEAAERYVAVDLDRVARPPRETDGPLDRGLRALVVGDAVRAERELLQAAETVPDSLRSFVYDRLVGSATRRFAWAEATGYARAAAEPLPPEDVSWAFYTDRPAPSATVDGGVATVPFDGYRADGSVHGPGGGAEVRFFLDSGSPVTLLSRPLADRLGLAIDTVSNGNVAIPARGIEAETYLTLIDSVRIGGALLRNVPAQVVDTDRPVTDGADLFLGFDALSGLLGGIRYGFADSTLTLYERGRTPGPDGPPNLLLEAGYALLAYEAGGQPFTGVVDTGSPFSYVYADRWTPPEGVAGRPVTHRGRLADTEYEFTLEYYDLPATIAGESVSALPLGLSRRGQVGAPFRVVSLLGTGLFADGSLLLDIDRRRATYTR